MMFHLLFVFPVSFWFKISVHDFYCIDTILDYNTFTILLLLPLLMLDKRSGRIYFFFFKKIYLHLKQISKKNSNNNNNNNLFTINLATYGIADKIYNIWYIL